MKSFPTEFANKRFVTGVDPDVCVESGAPVKCFTALVTFVGLFLGTNHNNHSATESRTTGVR